MSVFSRREMLKLGGASMIALASSAWGQTHSGSRTLMPAVQAFDHILFGCPDLDAGIKLLEERTGVRAMFGGVHPGRGTRNALLSLGKRQYLEIIAPDPAQATADERGAEVRKLTAPRVISWAVHTEDIAASKRAAEGNGLKLLGPAPGARQRPDGKMLRWQALGVETADTLIPFFIQWSADSPHPATDAPAAGTAVALSFESATPEETAAILRKMGIEAEVRRGREARIRVVLATARGRVEVS